MSKPDPSQNVQGLLIIYQSVREEIIARIRMRRRLVGFSFAFITAIIGYAFSGGSAPVNGNNIASELPTNAWIVAVVPWLIGTVVFEILRSGRILRKAGAHLQKIERALVDNPEIYGWETTSGSQSPGFSNFWPAAAPLLGVMYVVFCTAGILAWETAPESFMFAAPWLLSISYVVILIPTIWAVAQIYDLYNNTSTTEATDQSFSEDRTHSPDTDKNDTRPPRV